MSIENLWLVLVGVYFAWLTAVATIVTALGIGAWRTFRNYRQTPEKRK